MTNQKKIRKRKSGDPLVYIPDGAKINFENVDQNPPTTKYNAWTLIVDEKNYRKITGKFYGEDRNRRDS